MRNVFIFSLLRIEIDFCFVLSWKSILTFSEQNKNGTGIIFDTST